MPSDHDLLQAYVQRRDAEAFQALVERHGGMVYGTCLRVTRHRADAEDASQETFLELARRAAQVRDHLAGWLHRVAYRRALHLAHVRPRTADDLVADRALAAEEAGAARELVEQVDQALAALPDVERAVVVLRFLERRTQVEIAETLGVSQPTVHRRLQRGLAHLRRELGALGVVGALSLAPASLSAATATPVPAAILAGFGKVTLGVGVATGTAGPGLGLLAAAVVLATAAAAGGWWFAGRSDEPAPPPPSEAAAAVEEPSPEADPLADDEDEASDDDADFPPLRELVDAATYAAALARIDDAEVDTMAAVAADPQRPPLEIVTRFLTPPRIRPDAAQRWGSRLLTINGHPVASLQTGSATSAAAVVLGLDGESRTWESERDGAELAAEYRWHPARLVFAAGRLGDTWERDLALAAFALQVHLAAGTGVERADEPAPLALAETALFHARRQGAPVDTAFATVAAAVAHFQDRHRIALAWAETVDPTDHARDHAERVGTMHEQIAAHSAFALGRFATARAWAPALPLDEALDDMPDRPALAERVRDHARLPLWFADPTAAAARPPAPGLLPTYFWLAPGEGEETTVASGHAAAEVVADVVLVPQHPNWNRPPAELAVWFESRVTPDGRGGDGLAVLSVTNGGMFTVRADGAQTWGLIPSLGFAAERPLRLRLIAAEGECEWWLDGRRLMRAPLELPDAGWRVRLLVRGAQVRVRDLRAYECIESGADVGGTEYQRLARAVLEDDADGVRRLLATADPREVRLPEQRTLLHAAAWGERTAALAALLADGRLALDAIDANGDTPLSLAVRQCAPAAALRLLDAGADWRVGNRWGWLAFDYAAFQGDEALMRAMVARSVDPAAPNAEGADLIARVRSGAIGNDLAPAAARVLTDLGLDHPWLTALRIADEVRGDLNPNRQPLLLANHAELQRGPIGAWDETLVHLAVEYRNLGLVAFLLEHAGAAVDPRTRATDETPLHWAVARTRDPQVIALLLAHGADPTAVAAYGKSPLDLAREADFDWAVAALAAALPDEPPPRAAEDF